MSNLLGASPAGDSFVRDLRESVRHPEFWAFSSWLDVVCKYRRTRLGLLWMFRPMGIWITVLGNFYAAVMGHPKEEYLPYLGVGYLLWRYVVMCTNEAVGVLRTHKPFILDGRTRLTDFVLRTIAKASLYFVVGAAVIVVVLLWSPAIGTVLILGFLLTPILWVGERFPIDSVGGILVRLNPAFHLIELVRAPILGQAVPVSTIVYLTVLTLGGWLLALVLYRRYARFAPLWI